MLKVAILDDYQNVSQAFLNLQKLDGKYEFKIFNQSFLNEDDAGKQLKDFEALLIMRERTRITKFLIDRLTKLVIKQPPNQAPLMVALGFGISTLTSLGIFALSTEIVVRE